MADKRDRGQRASRRRKHVTRGGLVRETADLYPDEERALEERAAAIGRALRAYLDLLG